MEEKDMMEDGRQNTTLAQYTLRCMDEEYRERTYWYSLWCVWIYLTHLNFPILFFLRSSSLRFYARCRQHLIDWLIQPPIIAYIMGGRLWFRPPKTRSEALIWYSQILGHHDAFSAQSSDHVVLPGNWLLDQKRRAWHVYTLQRGTMWSISHPMNRRDKKGYGEMNNPLQTTYQCL